MNQIIIRLVDPKMPLFTLIAGTISSENGFVPLPRVDADNFIHTKLQFSEDFVRFDPLLGGDPYFSAGDFSKVLHDLIYTSVNVDFYPNILVFTYND